MKESGLRRVLPKSLAWLGMTALCGAMALAQQAPGSGPRTDGQIEMDVVHALDGQPSLKNDLITAATIQGEVTLSGTVSSDTSKQLAEQTVRGVAGVSGVHNNLKVGNPAADASAQGVSLNDDDSDLAQAQNQQTAQAQQQPTQSDQGQYAQQGQAYPQEGAQQGYGYGQYPPEAQQGYGQYPPPPGARQQYQRAPSYAMPHGPVTLPEGTVLSLRTVEPVSSKHATSGAPIQFTVIEDVTSGGVLAIPRGAVVHGVVADVDRAESGKLTGSSALALQLTSLDLGGHTYPLSSDLFKVKGPGKGERSAGNIVGGALIGALIGGAAGGGGGAAIGAAAGGTVGTAASAAQRGPDVWIPSEALVTFHLSAPITVAPVSAQEAARLAEGLYPGGPTLYRRPGPGYYGRPYPAPYPYYGPVYYRPYSFSGGFYYWR